jgi:hypothetical protein
VEQLEPFIRNLGTRVVLGEAAMLRRILWALTFVATLSAVGVAMPERAEAWGRWRRPFVARYYGPPAYFYDGYTPYRTYYPGDFGPRFYRPYYGGYYYGDPGYYYGPPRGGVYMSFGF